MKKLNAVATPPCYIKRYKAVVDAKHTGPTKTLLQLIHRGVSLRYTEYYTAFQNNNLQSMAELPAMQAHKDQLQSCYINSTKPLRDIFKAIKTAQTTRMLQRCPYCGITLPNTFDHYLPKGRFPEFSAHTLNLVPCCSSCNSSKNERWLDGVNRIFINYYLDPLPDDQYLQVQIISSPGSLAIAAEFSLVRPPAITDDQLWALIESHYDNLHLLNSYREEVNNEIFEIYEVCCCHLADGGNNVVNFLNGLSNSNAAILGANHWRVVLWRALAQDANFIDLIPQ